MAWLGGWKSRRKIEISNTNVGAVLPNFPILVKISASSGTGSTDITDIFTELTGDANRKKIAITTSDGTTQCYAEIERFDFASSLAWFYVRVPSVAASSVTTLYIYYDVAQADNTTYIGDTGDTPAQNVWDSNFTLVMHMAQDPSGGSNCIKDSTSNANHGTPSGSMTSADLVDGKIGKAIEFDGVDDNFSVSDNNSLDSTVGKTVEVIFNLNGAFDSTDAADLGLISKYTPGTSVSGHWLLRFESSTGKFKCGWVDASGNWQDLDSAKTSWAASTWFYVAIAESSSGAVLYVDESVDNSDAVNKAYQTNATNLRVGDKPNDLDRFPGKIDEIRYSDIPRSGAWAKATRYSNWDALVSFSAAEGIDAYLDEDISVNSVVDDNWPVIEENVNVISEFDFLDPVCPVCEDVSVNSEFIGLEQNSPISEEASVNSELVAEYTGELSEDVSVSAAISTIHQQVGEVSEEASVTSEITGCRYFAKTIQDTLSAWETLGWGWTKSISDTFAAADTASKILGIPVKEWLTLKDTETNNWNGTESLSDSFYTVDISKAIQVYYDLIADGMAITDAITAALRLLITEIFTCTDTIINTGIFQHPVEDGMILEDVARRLFPKSISDSFAATDTSLVDFFALLQISDSFNAADTAVRVLTINQIIADSLNALDSVAVQQLISELIQDGLNIEVVVTLDGEVYECWVLNTSAFYPSVYSGYDYNSFCTYNDTVYGAKSDGIYILEGDDDDGTEFYSGIILPASQFGSAANKRFRKAYFGVSGDNLVMKLETKSGSRTYRMVDTEMSLTRNLKGRKWRISLENFDELDFAELQPIILSRK